VDYANVYNSWSGLGPAIEGSMALDSLDADGFTVHMTDADPSARFTSYLALGPFASAAGPTPNSLMLVGVGI
jgi:hypothetical protein